MVRFKTSHYEFDLKFVGKKRSAFDLTVFLFFCCVFFFFLHADRVFIFMLSSGQRRASQAQLGVLSVGNSIRLVAGGSMEVF